MTSTAHAALRPRPFPTLRHSLVLARRSLIKTTRNPGPIVNGVVTPALFMVLFLYLFGGSVAGSTTDYLQYLFPGVMVMGAALAGLVATGTAISTDLKNGVTDRFRSMPISRLSPLLGSILADLIRYLAAVAVLFGIGVVLGFRVPGGLIAALAAIALTVGFGFALSWVAVLIATRVNDPSGVLAFSFLTFLPLQLGTSLAAPVETLPGWLQAWASVNPVSQAMDASRALLNGAPVGDTVVTTLCWSAILVATCCPLAVISYGRRR